MKKRLAVLAAMTSAALMLAGCSGGGESSQAGGRRSLQDGHGGDRHLHRRVVGLACRGQTRLLQRPGARRRVRANGWQRRRGRADHCRQPRRGEPIDADRRRGVARGQDVVNVFTYSTGAIFGIFTPKDSGVSRSRTSRSKKIGVSEAGGGEVAFSRRPYAQRTLTPSARSPSSRSAMAALRPTPRSPTSPWTPIFDLQRRLRPAGQRDAARRPHPDFYKDFPARGIITTSRVVSERPDAEELRSRYCDGHRVLPGQQRGMHQLPQGGQPRRVRGQCRWRFTGPAALRPLAHPVPPKNPDRIGAHDDEETRLFLDTIASTMEGSAPYDLNKFLNTEFLDYANDFDRPKVREAAAKYTG